MIVKLVRRSLDVSVKWFSDRLMLTDVGLKLFPIVSVSGHSCYWDDLISHIFATILGHRDDFYPEVGSVFCLLLSRLDMSLLQLLRSPRLSPCVYSNQIPLVPSILTTFVYTQSVAATESL